LNDSHRTNNLSKTNPKQQLTHGTVLDKSIMGSDRGQTLVGLRSGVNSEAKIHSGETDYGKLADTSVLDFGLCQKVHGEKVRESERVKSEISDISVKIRWCLEERKRDAGNVGGGSWCSRGGWLSRGFACGGVFPDQSGWASCDKTDEKNVDERLHSSNERQGPTKSTHRVHGADEWDTSRTTS
jgi:hypothetical protein